MIEFIKKTPVKVACLIVSYLIYVQILESFLIVLNTDEAGKVAIRLLAGEVFAFIILYCFKGKLLERIRRESRKG